VFEAAEGPYRGILMHKTDKLTAMVRSARAKGFRLEVHCIGDRAAEQVNYCSL
jgi:predicted amidohydrolase YtcJ